jgi:hypothetical protein
MYSLLDFYHFPRPVWHIQRHSVYLNLIDSVKGGIGLKDFCQIYHFVILKENEGKRIR